MKKTSNKKLKIKKGDSPEKFDRKKISSTPKILTNKIQGSIKSGLDSKASSKSKHVSYL